MALDLGSVASLLESSLDPRQSKQAEQQLKQYESNPGFSVALLQIVASTTYNDSTRLAGSVFFKNFVSRNWTDEDGNHKLPPDEVTTIKRELVTLMISLPPKFQAQLGEAISKIADSDFWERWDTLVKDLAGRLTPDNAIVNNGVLTVAHSIFERWRILERTDPLFTEINHVLSDFSAPYMATIQSTDQNISQSQNDKQALRQHIETMILILKLFYDLSYQDLPPVFEESMSDLCGLLSKYLTYDNPLLHSDDDAEAGPLEELKSITFEALTLYVQKYADALGPYLAGFMATSWQLLTTIGPEPKYDALVCKALKFLTDVVKIKEYADSFNNQDTLGQVVEKVVLPNIETRDSDLETFEDEPIDFIRSDLEGSDSDSRRRAATDFLREIQNQFETLTTTVVAKYYEHYLSKHNSDPKNNWRAKDTAVWLFSSIAAKGTPSQARGLAATNPNVDVLGFFQTNVATDLTTQSAQPLLKVDAIKYLYTFRNQLNKDQWQAAFPLLAESLNSQNYVIYTYAAITIERVLVMHDDQRQPLVAHDMVQSVADPLLRRLFTLISKDARPQKVQENEFLAKCVMRILIILRAGVVPLLDMLLKNMVNITRVIRHNPSGPLFYYYHFETYGALVRYTAATHSSQIEEALLPTFSEILRADSHDFQSYVLQIFALLLETCPPGTSAQRYLDLLPITLNLDMYSTRTTVPALVRVLTAIIPRASEQIAANNQIESILLVFQKLISSKANESYAFDLIETVIDAFPVSALSPYIETIFRLIFQRYEKHRTEILAQRIVRFYHFVASRDAKGLGADYFVQVAEKIQENMFAPFYQALILPDTQRLTRPYDRKIAVISLGHTLATSSAFAGRYSKKGWGLTCEALLLLLINPPLPPAKDDANIEEVDPDDVAFGVGYTALKTCKPSPRDPFPEVQDVRKWLGGYLKEQDAVAGGRISQYVQQKLSDDAKNALSSIMA